MIINDWSDTLDVDGGMVSMVVVVGGGGGLVVGGLVGGLVSGKEGDFMKCLHVEAQHC